MERSPAIQNLLDSLAKSMSVPQAIIDGSEHPYTCRCDTCLAWWANMPPEDSGELEPDGRCGPFTWAEVWAYQDANGMERTEGFCDEDDLPLG
jgi:hypothetical protein